MKEPVSKGYMLDILEKAKDGNSKKMNVLGL